MTKILPLILILVAVVFEVVADTIFKKWAVESKNFLFYAGMLVYIIGTTFWAISLKYEYLSRAVSVFTVLNLVILVAVGVILFKEDLSLINKVGIGLGVLSIVLIEI